MLCNNCCNLLPPMNFDAAGFQMHFPQAHTSDTSAAKFFREGLWYCQTCRYPPCISSDGATRPECSSRYAGWNLRHWSWSRRKSRCAETKADGNRSESVSAGTPALPILSIMGCGIVEHVAIRSAAIVVAQWTRVVKQIRGMESKALVRHRGSSP